MSKQNTRQYVLNLLNSYPEMQRKVSLLRYELLHPANISADEMIDAMSFAHNSEGTGQKGTVSNKTLYIAMNYQSEMARLNIETTDGIVQRLIPLENEIKRLEYYVTLLQGRLSETIRLYYFERQSLEEIAGTLEVTTRTVISNRKKAVEALVETYEFVKGKE